MTSLPPVNAHWIRTPDELDRWLEAAAGRPLAVDTEFERVSTFFPIPGLVQLGIDDQFRLVDPSVAEASRLFRGVLADPDIPKLLYAMSEDLELFRHWLDVRPAGVIDLQIGAALAGAGFSVGYAKLVEKLFGETLDKSATRSDWVSRPLTSEQEQYALDDIRFLQPVYGWVREALERKNLWPALAEESARFAEDLYGQDDPSSHYLRLRGGWSLGLPQQQVLQALTQWRELESRQRDRPRNRVVPDAVLIAMAEAMPGSKPELQRVQGLPPVVVRRYGEHLLALVERAREGRKEGFVAIRPPLTREQQKLYKQVKQLLVKLAETSAVPIELLAPRKRLEVLVQNGVTEDGPVLSGWRETLIAPVLDDIKAILKV